MKDYNYITLSRTSINKSDIVNKDPPPPKKKKKI